MERVFYREIHSYGMPHIPTFRFIPGDNPYGISGMSSGILRQNQSEAAGIVFGVEIHTAVKTVAVNAAAAVYVPIA
jgi:hypothetical protein